MHVCVYDGLRVEWLLYYYIESTISQTLKIDLISRIMGKESDIKK